MIIAGDGAVQSPHLLVPISTIENAAAPAIPHELMVGGLAAGAVILLPAQWYLFRVFKGKQAFALPDQYEKCKSGTLVRFTPGPSIIGAAP